MTGVHPVDVSAEGVDFAIVDDVAVGMGPFPAGEGIGAEPRVDHGQSCLNGRVGQLRIILLQLLRHQHSFINNGFVREAGEVERFATHNLLRVADGLFSQFANDVEFALKSHWVGDTGTTLDKHLAHKRFGQKRRFAE